MTATNERPGLSLGKRVAIGSALLVALPAAAAVLAALFFGGRIADGAVAASLSRSRFVQEHFRAQRADQLALISRVFSSDPAFTGYVAEAAGAGLGSPRGVDSLSIVDLLADRREELGYDFALVLDPRGHVLARTDRPGEVGQDFSSDPLVARAIERLTPETGLWTSAGGLYQAAIVPLAAQLDLVGFLVTALAVDDDLAVDMARVGGTDVAFVVSGGDGRVSILASSLDLARSSALARALAERSAELSPVLHDARELPRLDLVLEGEALVGRVDALTDAAGRPVGALVALGSLDRQRQAFRNIQNVVLLAGALSMAVTLVLSFWYVRRALDPVRRLAEAAEAAARGDYGHDLEPAKADELSRVASAFNSLLEDLRERLAMAAYVQEIARHLPEPAAAAAVAAGSDPRAELPTEEAGLSPGPGGATTGEHGPGTVVAGRYEILATLGSGGMGRVFKARDLELGELVALKVLHERMRGFPEHLERVKNEIRLARKITHPNVLRTFDYGEDHGVPYISMEYVRGLTLEYLLRQTRGVPCAAGLFLARQVASGLAAAHAVGILHRDIKPANLILEPGGNAKLMDFGVALPIRAAGAASGRAGIAGTPYYLAPEVLEGDEPSVAADLYSVGVVLYEVFGGARPFPLEQRLEALVEIKRRPPAAPPARGAAAPMPPELERLVLRCLDPDPARRPQSAEALRAELETLRC